MPENAEPAGSPVERPAGPAQHLEDSASRLAVLHAGARDGLWDWDLAAGLVRYSARWKQIAGCREDEIGTSPEDWFRRVHPRDLEGLRRALDACLAGESAAFEHEFRLLHQDGGWRRVVCRGAA